MRAPPFKRIFVANRGEIAVRAVRACKALGIERVVAVSEADRDTLVARLATSAICIGLPAATASYLRPETLVTALSAPAARRSIQKDTDSCCT